MSFKLSPKNPRAANLLSQSNFVDKETTQKVPISKPLVTCRSGSRRFRECIWKNDADAWHRETTFLIRRTWVPTLEKFLAFLPACCEEYPSLTFLSSDLRTNFLHPCLRWRICRGLSWARALVFFFFSYICHCSHTRKKNQQPQWSFSSSRILIRDDTSS
jgi:hypothetical protein